MKKRNVSSEYQGYMDMSYFSLSTKALKVSRRQLVLSLPSLTLTEISYLSRDGDKSAPACLHRINMRRWLRISSRISAKKFRI
jgi:hypothetical protein